jgi:hypothetical protein
LTLYFLLALLKAYFVDAAVLKVIRNFIAITQTLFPSVRCVSAANVVCRHIDVLAESSFR